MSRRRRIQGLTASFGLGPVRKPIEKGRSALCFSRHSWPPLSDLLAPHFLAQPYGVFLVGVDEEHGALSAALQMPRNSAWLPSST
jgi:hypothetical protein